MPVGMAPIMLLDTRPQEREKGDARVFDSLLPASCKTDSAPSQSPKRY